MRKLDRRSTITLAVAAVAAIAVNAGVAWAYWVVNGQATTSARAAAITELDLSAGTDPANPLYPGATRSLSLTITNGNEFPVVVNGLAPAPQPITVDPGHGAQGCPAGSVSLTDSLFLGNWPVGPGGTGTFVVPAALTMAANTPQSCAGAAFTIPIKVVGVSGS